MGEREPTGKGKGMELVAFYQRLLHPAGPWRVTRAELAAAGDRVDVWLEHAPGVNLACPECGRACPVYDHTGEREWQHLDTCEAVTVVHARLPRVNCGAHGVVQVAAPWAAGSSHFTVGLERRGITTLLECSLEGAARLTGLSWDELAGMLTRAVERGLARRAPGLPARVGIDEKAVFKRHKYCTLITDLDGGRVVEVLEGRKLKDLEGWFAAQGEPLAKVRDVALDMSAGYAKLMTRFAPQAALSFDHFHVTQLVGHAVDEVRKAEQAQITDPERHQWFFRARFLPLYNAENVPEKRQAQFAELKQVAVKTARAWALKENFRELWHCQTAEAAEAFFRKWYWWATHSRLAPMCKAAHTLKRHWQGIVNAITHRVTNACTEGLNSKIEKVKRDAYGFRNKARLRLAILFHCGGLDLYPHPAPG